MMDALARWSEVLWLGMAAHLWQTTLVLALLAVVRIILRDAPARWIAALWQLAIIKLFLPLQLFGGVTERITASLWTSPIPENSVHTTPAFVTVSTWFYRVALQIPATEQQIPGVVYIVLTAIWLAGIAVLTVHYVLGARTARGELTEPVALDGAGASKLERAIALAGLRAGTVVTTAGSGLPAVYGLVRPRIRLSEQLIERLGLEDLRLILLHEEEHRQHHDCLRLLLLRCASTIFFLYPPLWWLTRAFHEANEMACDEAVVRAGVSRDRYRRTLARTLALGLSPARATTAMLGQPRSTLRNRLRRLASTRRYAVMRKHRLALTMGSCAVIIASFLPVTSSPPSASDDPADGNLAEQLDRLAVADLPVLLDFKETEIDKLLQTLTKAATPLEVEIVEPFRRQTVSIQTGKVPLREALIQLALQAGLQYEVVNEHKVRVRSTALLAGVDGVTNPRLIPASKVEPVYPEELRAQGIEGQVIYRAMIDQNGLVQQLEVLRASPPEHHSLFVEAAAEAIKQWRYDPATWNGAPVSVYFVIFIEFKLHGEPSHDRQPGAVSL